jgi:transcriptional regulator with XRE-family HTH domain
MRPRQSEKTEPGLEKIEERLKREFSSRLRHLRVTARLTQSQVAKALGFSSESVYQLWEKGTGNLPSALNLHKLALYFHVSTDYLLGLREEQPLGKPQEGSEDERNKLAVFQLALQGKDWDAPELETLLRSLLRSRWESLEQCYERVLTDVTYPTRPRNLPRLSDFYTPAARQTTEDIEALFRQRPANQARRVKMYVLDLGLVPSRRLQRLILGMQGAELIKQRQANFTLGISNGRMARDVILAPNLVRGDIQNISVIPLVFGRSQDNTSATTLIGNLVFEHGDYQVERVYLKDEKRAKRIAMLVGSIHLAFMGVGSVEPNDPESLFAKLLAEQGLVPGELGAGGIIGNILYHFIREDPSGRSWEHYNDKRICVSIDDPADEEVLHAVSLDILRELVEIREAQIVLVVKDPSRANVVRAALEMRWANSVICTLTVAQELLTLLSEKPVL